VTWRVDDAARFGEYSRFEKAHLEDSNMDERLPIYPDLAGKIAGGRVMI